ncbi:WD domain, G-beta repeat protein (macronuclear) [Tetrahymena thermophila SB210]|uniref:WD domain, G-beta repeat protein n=1 Tax=Tetrahymena thermophila (strain SB210) TaxID=312017 RepID=I7M3C6_TETTS|nr:WD domain, G-beta repeat protein [Tetrahymena thermophila SB210]EAS02896.2 WD domain, G-beta repeat protein [Tetrahymena thermophila SB210]|eukprot:XP_001023141.2 WD domain, G-beta repeat protein [Tetrahymena thermophila SB210]
MSNTPSQCAPIYSIHEHKDVIRSVVKMEQGYFLTCSHDGSIKLWNINNISKTIKNLRINNDFVINALRIGNTKLILSVHPRGVVCIWSLNKGICLKRIQVCEKEIYCAINISDLNLIAFGTSSGKVFLYNIFTSTCNLQIQEENSISSIYYSNYQLFVATRDKEINIYLIEKECSFSEEQQIQLKQSRIQIKLQYICSCMTQIDPKTLIVGTTEGLIYIYRYEKNQFQVIKEFYAHRQTVINLKLLENELYSTGYDGCIIKWDLIVFEKQVRYFGHRYAVYAINIIKDYLITAGADKQILIWNKNESLTNPSQIQK